MPTKSKSKTPMKDAEIKSEGRYVGPVTSRSKRNRPVTYYKLSEADHPTIIEGLRKFASLYHIAMKIGCGYTTLKVYLSKHPELLAIQKESKEAINEFVESQFLRKIASGHLGAMCFYAERKMGWTNRQQIDTNMPLPNIVMGVIPESDIPDGIGEPVQLTGNTAITKRPDPTEECRETQEPEDAESEFLDDDNDDSGEDWDASDLDESSSGLF